MDYPIHRRRHLPFKFLFLVIGAGTGSSPAFAQYPPPGSVAPSGSIIISRDVPQRPAFAPGQPGTVNPVETAPVAMIFGATSQVAILTDDQSADVAAGAQSQQSALGTAYEGADAALNPQFGSGPGQVAAGSLGGGAIGGAISGAIGAASGAIGRALGPLSSGSGE